MVRRLYVIVALGAASLNLSGCAPKLGAGQYSVSDVKGGMSNVHYGTIVSKNTVQINTKEAGDESRPGTGAVMGAVAGGALGSQIGGGRARYATGALGALAAGVAGHFVEEYMTTAEGFSYQIKLDRGGLVNVTQGTDPVLSVGQRVSVVEPTSGRGRARVVPA